MKQQAVFLDRDGTLNKERGYIRDLNDLELIDGACEAVLKLNKHNIPAILVTNQTGAARGYYDIQHIENLNNKVQTLLAHCGAKLDKMYYCPHLEGGIIQEYSFDCHCRKPKSGMIEQALQDFPEINIHQSYVIGDKATDVELAIAVGAKGILLKTGYGERVLKKEYQNLSVQPAFIAENIAEAIDWVLQNIAQP